MQREILFRGKRVDDGEWVCGSLLSFDDGGRAILPSAAKVFKQSGTTTICCNECYDVDPATVGQYTGLTDKNGVKIFEWDILCVDEPEDPSGSYLPVFGFVRFGEYETNNTKNVGFFVEWKDNEDDNYSETFRNDFGYWVKYRYCEVIGNIHDNPDMLSEGDAG